MAETLIAAQGVAIPTAKTTRRSIDLEIWIPAALLTFILGACFLGPLLFNVASPNAVNFNAARLGLGSPGHLLGTDELGRDLLSRCLYGGQTSFEVGFGSVALGLVVGATLGIACGFSPGFVDSVIMRILDVLLAFPSLVLALVVSAYLGPGERNVIIAIAFFTIPTYARVARAAAIQIHQRDYVLAARLSGAGRTPIIVRHVMPNIAGRLLTYGLLTVGVAMIVEASLSFLGLGVQPPQASWGSMIALGKDYLTTAPQMVLVPGAFLVVSVITLNLVGDGLRAWFQRRGEA
jgi:peptide/nickel transport system permease protein